MARVPQGASVDVQVAIKDVNAEFDALKTKVDLVEAQLPSPKEIEELKGAVARLAKTPTYLDPNDVFRASGPAHMHGFVPDPGVTPGTAKFLREDATWQPASGGAPGPHTHASNEITHVGSGYIAADDVKEALEELDSEKLARSGAQDMLGNLDMGGNEVDDVKNIRFTGGVGEGFIEDVRTIFMEGVGEITGAKLIDMSASVVGEGIINAPRVIHMVGDDSDGEARIDGLERTVFNNEPSKSVIDNPSRVDWNTGVAAGVSYSPELGQMGWDTLEDTVVVFVQSGAGLVAIAMGWAASMAINGVSGV